MNKLLRATGYLFILLGAVLLFARDGEKMVKTFPVKKTVKIKTVSGDCRIKAGSGDEITVEVNYDVEPADAFKPDIEEGNHSIRIKEHWYNSSRGSVLWTITVPEGVKIEFSSASGELNADGLKGDIETSTASGDITLNTIEGDVEISSASGEVDIQNIKGDISLSTASGDVEAMNISGSLDMSTASGDIKVDKAAGEFDMSCASGSIKLKDVEVKDESSFSTASGEIYISLAETPEYDMEFSSASGDVTVDYNGNDLKGSFEFTARKSRGSISAPVDFDDQSEFERHGQTYVKKSFSRDGKQPLIKLNTASGDVRLKQ